MKNTFVVLVLSLFLASCDDVLFEQPQPASVKNEAAFPLSVRGTYVNVARNDTIYITTDRIRIHPLENDGWLVLSDSVILRTDDENYFLNMRDEHGGWIVILSKNEEMQFSVYRLNGEDEKLRKNLGEITALKEIKKDSNYAAHYMINPTDKEFQKILDNHLFEKTATYRKIS